MRRITSKRPVAVRTTVAAFAAVSTLGLAACGGTAGDEEGADVADVAQEDVVEEDVTEEDAAGEDVATGPFEGPYDSAFYDEVDSYVGEEVVLSADVNEVLSPMSFTIAGTDDTTVESLLVVGAGEDNQLAPETTVEVTGTVEESFVIEDVEEQLGVDLEDELFTDFDQEPYVMAGNVEVLENVD
ncbi:hypothetical protein [Modestobacter lapidis]|nr:hypothetical protein [Modestobacter lapidis]